jgi:hypothetical protein
MLPDFELSKSALCFVLVLPTLSFRRSLLAGATSSSEVTVKHAVVTEIGLLPLLLLDNSEELDIRRDGLR